MDQTSENLVLKNLKDNEDDKTLLLVTQKMSLLALVDRVIVMNNSQKVLDGTKEYVINALGGQNG